MPISLRYASAANDSQTRVLILPAEPSDARTAIRLEHSDHHSGAAQSRRLGIAYREQRFVTDALDVSQGRAY